MMKMEQSQKVWAAIAGGFLTPLFENLYGDSETVRAIMSAIAVFILMDWISGTRASKKDNTYASKYGIDGVFRTFFILLLPAGGHLLDWATQLPGICFGLLSFGVLYHVLQSMTANTIRAGWADWVPVKILEKLIDWVGSEIDSKVSRAAKRKEERVLNHGK
jgi:phage-related holin